MKRPLVVLGMALLCVVAISCGSKSKDNALDEGVDPTDTVVVVPDASVAPGETPSMTEAPFHSDDPEVQALYDLISSGAGAPSEPSVEPAPVVMDPTLPTVMLGSGEYADTPAGQRVWLVQTSCDSAKAGLGAQGECGPDTGLTFTDGSHEGVLWVQDPAGPVGVQLNGN
jgi:hypothetical protein